MKITGSACVKLSTKDYSFAQRFRGAGYVSLMVLLILKLYRYKIDVSLHNFKLIHTTQDRGSVQINSHLQIQRSAHPFLFCGGLHPATHVLSPSSVQLRSQFLLIFLSWNFFWKTQQANKQTIRYSNNTYLITSFLIIHAVLVFKHRPYRKKLMPSKWFDMLLWLNLHKV